MKDEILFAGEASPTDRFNASARPVLTVDVEKYQAYLDESGLSDEQKEEFLRALWSIMVSFVELGFGVHPLQEVCGQNGRGGTQRLTDEFNRVDSGKPEIFEPKHDSGPPGGLEAE